MSSSSQQVKSAMMIAGLVFLTGVAILLVWFLSPAALGVPLKIFLTMFILLVWPVWILIKHYRGQRVVPGPDAAANGRAVEPRQGKKVQLPPPTGTYEELVRSTEEVMRWLRDSKLGETRSSDAASALPLYALAGPPGSGKTSLLLASGLSFHVLPSQRASEQNIIRPTPHTEWRVTDSAIWLDTTGRYQTEGAAQDEWAALIETIKRHRKVRPLDGFVLTVNAGALLRLSETEIEQQAKVLRTRLDEAMQRTSSRFPVYLVFTHMDEINGFAEYFNSFTVEERVQVWGSTIPLAQSENAQAQFDFEFDHLYGRLVRRRMVQLGVPATPEQQLRMFKFPGRFRRTRSRLGRFTSALFRPHPFSESPLLRGFYFTSNSGVGAANARQLTGTEYFTQNLFKEVLLPDRNIVAAAQASQQRPNLRRNALLATAVVLLLMFLAGMVVSFFNNKALIAEADARGRRLTELRKVTSKAQSTMVQVGDELKAVEEVRELLTRLDEYERDSPPLSLRFGLYAGRKLNSSDPSSPSILRHLYFEAIDERYLKPTVLKMQQDLEKFAAGAGTPASVAPATASVTTEEGYLGRHYDLLKAYLMLTKPERVEPMFLAQVLRDYWQAAAPPGLEETALRQLEYFASQAHREDAPHPETNHALVARAQDKLVAYPVVNRVYKRITADINTAVKYPVKLSTIPNARDGNVLTSSYSVPGSFTIDGYRAMTEKLNSSAADEFRKDDWVMRASDLTEQNLDVKKDELANMYDRDYVAQWQKFLQEIKVREFTSKEDAKGALRVLAGSTSPLESVMREVVRQTNLSGSGSGVSGWIKRLFARQKSGGATQVEKEFRPLIQFMSGKADASPMAEYRTHLKKVHDGLNSNNKPVEEISKALQAGNDTIGLRVARQTVADALEAKGFHATPASDAAANLLMQPFNNLEILLVGTDFQQIEKNWQQLFAKAQSLEAGFPFTDGGSDISMAGLAQFLNPQDGELTKFFNERLKPYFEDDWTIKKESSDKFSPAFVNYLMNARKLRDALFPEGAKQPKAEYQMTLAPVPDTLIRMEIDGQVVSTPEKPSANLAWPGDKSGVKITLTPTSGQDETKAFAGEWGLLRMFRESGGGDGQGAQFGLQTLVGTNNVRLMIQPKSGNPFRRELFTALKAPPSMRQNQ